MFKYFANRALKKEVEKYKKDNLTLMGKVSALEESLAKHKKDLAYERENTDRLDLCCNEKNLAIQALEEKVKDLESDSSKKVTYANARKALTKAKLKQLRDKLEAVPGGATGFGGSVSVYDKKTKRLAVVQLTSKEQALEILSRAEKGHVDIVI